MNADHWTKLVRVLIPLRNRQRETKRRSLAQLRLHPDAPAAAFHHPPANAQTKPGSGNLAAMQPLKDSKDLLLEPGIDANAVIGHGKAPFLARSPRRNMNFGRVLLAIFDGIGDEILK